MHLSRREFAQLLGAGAVAGMGLARWQAADAATAGEALYDVPRFGNVSFLHFTDCHAQLKPIHFREPSVNLGVADMQGRLPHLVGEHLLAAAKVPRGSAEAHALTYLDFEAAARRYGKVGGFAHLATLVKRLKASRPGALLLDGGDTWQGSATALWTKGQDMVDAAKLLGVDVMTGHWEFTLGMDRVKEIVEKDFAKRIEFIAQNVKTTDFGDPVFQPYVLREINGVPCGIIGQAFPYTPIANPRYFVAEWEFGIRDAEMQKVVDEARGKGAQVVVLLSHNGMDVDLKLAGRVSGIDAIFGGHTHDGVPVATVVPNRGGRTLVTNAGSNGKFLAVMDFDVKGGKVADFRYRLLPVFANLLPADREMDALITRVRGPYEAKLAEQLAVTEGTLWRRGNFNGSGDQLLLDALMDVQGTEIAFSPGFRWGTTLLAGQPITREWLMDMTATTYSHATVSTMSGEMIRTVLEDVADNLFNPDPYYQQGGDMVRVGGLQYAIDPTAAMGKRITDMRLNGQPIEASRTYKVAGWAPVSEEAAKAGNRPVWELVEQWLRARGGKVAVRQANLPVVKGAVPNAGMTGLHLWIAAFVGMTGLRSWISSVAGMTALSLFFIASAAAQTATFATRSLTPEAALRAAQAALQSCAKAGYQVTVAVSDRAGHPLVLLRDRFAGPHTTDTAMNKAYTAVTFKLDTLSFARVTREGEAMSGIRYLPRVVAIGGGLPIEAAGALVGGIGVSGAPGGEADDACAKAGIAAIRDDLEF